MAGPWLLAALVAAHFLVVKADLDVDNLFPRLEHLKGRQILSGGNLTTSLIPVATICTSDNGLNTSFTPTGDYSTTTATVTLPGGGSAVFATRVQRQVQSSSTDAPGAAHLVSGTDGCSTLFTPTTFSACSTVVSPIGLPPVTITECDQYVTFSSETLFMCAPTPTITLRPASSSPYNNLAGSFTSRPNLLQNDTFMNATTTYTPGADSNDVELASSSTSAYSEASGMPMSLSHQHAEKRQVMFGRDGKLMEMEPAIIAPGKHLNPRQLMFHQEGDETMADAVIVAPSTTSSLRMMDTGTPARHMMMASGMTGTGNLRPANQTVVGINAPAFTKLMPIPEMLKAKYKRRYIAVGHKARENDAALYVTALALNSSTIDEAIASSAGETKRDNLLENNTHANMTTPLNLTSVRRALSSGSIKLSEAYNVTTGANHVAVLRGKNLHAAVHDSHSQTRHERFADASSQLSNAPRTNSTRLASKLAKLDTICLANANQAAREAQAPGGKNLSPPSPTKFYAAPWSEIIEGGVPEHILGITCYGGGDHIGKCTEPDSDGDPEECECVTERQSWSVSTVTFQRIGTTVVSYSGPLVVTGAGVAVMTTNVQFLSTMSTTRMVSESMIVKKTLTGEETVTQTMTSVPSATISLLPIEIGTGDTKAAAPQGAPASVTGEIDMPTTVVMTSYVATETVTVPPAEETNDGSDGSDDEMVPGYESDVNGSNVKRDGPDCNDPDAWPCNVWMSKLKTAGTNVEVMAEE